jgi:hypothetical protein
MSICSAARPDELVAERTRQAADLIASTRARWQFLLENIDRPLAQVRERWPRSAWPRCSRWPRSACRSSATLFVLLQDRSIRVSWKTEVREPLARILQGQAFLPLLKRCDEIHKRVLRSRVFVACTCMPATATCTPTCRSTPTTTAC